MQQLGLNFEICSPDVDESVLENESIAAYVERLAQVKAEAVARLYPDTIIIAADTSLGVNNEILGNLNPNSMPLKCGKNFRKMA